MIRFIAWTYETGFSGDGKLYRSGRVLGRTQESVAVGVYLDFLGIWAPLWGFVKDGIGLLSRR